MSYFTRVFCCAETFPAFNVIVRHMRILNSTYRLEAEVDENGGFWTSLDFYYKDGKCPIPVELSWCDEEGSIGAEELVEFIEEIGPPGLSFAKREVIEHLKKTKFLVCNQLLSDLDDEGYEANDRLMQFFVEGFQGMMHADDEGFYKSDGQLLLRVG